jgi:hypothetical protein
MIARFDFDGTYNDDQGHTSTKLIAANIQLGGFLVGLADSYYSSFTGYAGDIINDDVVSYGGFEVNQIANNFDNGAGITAVIALQDDRRSGNALVDVDNNPATPDVLVLGADNSGDGYMPDVVAGIGYSTETFGFKVVGGYDESVEEGAIKARLDGKFGAVSAFVMAAWNSDGDTVNDFAPGDQVGSWGDWAAWAGLGYQITDNAAANVQLAYTDNETFAAAANVKWEPVNGLIIQPEVTYTKWDDSIVGDDDDQWNGMVRFQRTF